MPSTLRCSRSHRPAWCVVLSAIGGPAPWLALLWVGSFVFLAAAPLLPRQAIVAYLSAVTVLYTVAVMVHAGVIDALVVEAAPDTLRGRYVAAFNLSWAVANALAPGLFTIMLAWYRVAVDRADSPVAACPGGCAARRAETCQPGRACPVGPGQRDAAIAGPRHSAATSGRSCGKGPRGRPLARPCTNRPGSPLALR